MRKRLGIICILFAVLCIVGIGMSIAFLIFNFFNTEWWKMGLIFSSAVLCWIGFAMLIHEGLCLLGIY